MTCGLRWATEYGVTRKEGKSLLRATPVLLWPVDLPGYGSNFAVGAAGLYMAFFAPPVGELVANMT
jgi:hypothetical protein